jgi:hypothetical protein
VLKGYECWKLKGLWCLSDDKGYTL